MTKENKNTLLIIGGGAAAYFLVIQPALIKFGLMADPKVTATDTRKHNQLNDAIKAVEAVKPSTKTIQEWQIIADSIYSSLRSNYLFDDKKNAVYQVCRVQNDTDLLLLYKYFGKRKEYLIEYLGSELMDLAQFITSNLSQKQLDLINWNYKNKGIKFRF